MFVFGSGVLFGYRTDGAGPYTPMNFGLVQEVQLDLQFTTKELYGQYQFPVAVARGEGKMTGKAKMAKISGLAFSNLFFGQSLSAGQLITNFGEAHSIPATPFTITVTNSATFADDLGVIYSSSGLPLTKVTSAPAAGQYSVAAGVYTFAAADTGTAVLINYTSNQASGGQSFTYSNQLMGTTPTFGAQFYTTFQGIPLNVKMFSCVSSKLQFASKLEDFTIPEIDFMMVANAAGNVFEWSYGEVS